MRLLVEGRGIQASTRLSDKQRGVEIDPGLLDRSCLELNEFLIFGRLVAGKLNRPLIIVATTFRSGCTSTGLPDELTFGLRLCQRKITRAELLPWNGHFGWLAQML